MVNNSHRVVVPLGLLNQPDAGVDERYLTIVDDQNLDRNAFPGLTGSGV